ncbi:MAG: D-aminoacylase [Acidobacteria bacterium]|nr:D-aminoacylase [Acidobacteriota bacterium]
MRPLALILLCSLPALAQYDLIIRNARVVDGSGQAAFTADLAVKDGRIAAIGDLKGKTAEREIDAVGRVAAPGFIDVHTHIEGAVDKAPRADNFLMDGVTTVVTGNCGGSAEALGEWYRKLEESGVGINIASLVGHNTVRRQVMGTANRHATPDELEQMKTLVAQAMEQGAVGFSTGLIYIPGTYSNTAEVVELARAAAARGGVYASHMRDEGARILEAIREAARVGQEAGMRVELSHFKIDTPRIWGFSAKSLALVEELRAKGLDIGVDQYPYDHSSTGLGITLPSWALADGPLKVRRRLKSPATRARIAAEMKGQLSNLGHKDYSYATVASFEPNREYEGKTIPEVTRLKGWKPTLDNQIRAIFDIQLAGGAQMVYHSMGEADVNRIMRYPHTAVASDGGVRVLGEGMPHPRSYGTNARVLAEYVRMKQVLTLEDAVRRMTSLPAGRFNLKDRGVLREGAAADIVVFDPARVQDLSTYTEPHQYSMGFDFVFVNGVAAVDEGQPNEKRPGRILRRQ